MSVSPRMFQNRRALKIMAFLRGRNGLNNLFKLKLQGETREMHYWEFCFQSLGPCLFDHTASIHTQRHHDHDLLFKQYFTVTILQNWNILLEMLLKIAVAFGSKHQLINFKDKIKLLYHSFIVAVHLFTQNLHAATVNSLNFTDLWFVLWVYLKKDTSAPVCLSKAVNPEKWKGNDPWTHWIFYETDFKLSPHKGDIQINSLLCDSSFSIWRGLSSKTALMENLYKTW